MALFAKHTLRGWTEPSGATRSRRLWIAANAAVLVIGMVAGGLVQDLGRRALPAGAVREFLTTGISFSSAGRFHLGFFIGSVDLGPVAIDVSLVSLAVLVVVVAEGRRFLAGMTR